MTNNQELAEEIVQEVFVKVWKNIKKYDSQKSKFFTWLYKITRNTALNALNRKSEKINRSMDYGKELNFEPSVNLNIDEMDILGGLKKIDPKYGKVISTVYLAGYTQKETSERLGIPLGIVKTRIRLGLNELKKYYGLPIICILGIMSLIKYVALYG